MTALCLFCFAICVVCPPVPASAAAQAFFFKRAALFVLCFLLVLSSLPCHPLCAVMSWPCLSVGCAEADGCRSVGLAFLAACWACRFLASAGFEFQMVRSCRRLRGGVRIASSRLGRVFVAWMGVLGPLLVRAPRFCRAPFAVSLLFLGLPLVSALCGLVCGSALSFSCFRMAFLCTVVRGLAESDAMIVR
jgi:hypothetical protein